MARPIPRLEPVTIATFPLSCKSMVQHDKGTAHYRAKDAAPDVHQVRPEDLA